VSIPFALWVTPKNAVYAGKPAVLLEELRHVCMSVCCM